MEASLDNTVRLCLEKKEREEEEEGEEREGMEGRKLLMMVHDNGLVGTWGMWTRESVFQKPSWLHENLPQTHREKLVQGQEPACECMLALCTETAAMSCHCFPLHMARP